MPAIEYENRDEYIIKKYQQDENTMIQLFAHWCKNHGLDPFMLYQRAYPYQTKNDALVQAVKEADAEPEDIEIGHAVILEILQLFGNDDLAFVVVEEIEKLSKK